jgi:hypothetical protein
VKIFHVETYTDIAKVAQTHVNETYVIREPAKRRSEAPEMRFLQPLLGTSLRDNVTRIDIRKQLGTERMGKIYKSIKGNCTIMLKGYLLNVCGSKAHVYYPTGRRDIGCQKR